MFRAISRRVAEIVSDYPLKTTGAIAVIVGSSVAYRWLVGHLPSTETTSMGFAPTQFVEFGSAHPAYVLAILGGLALVVLAE